METKILCSNCMINNCEEKSEITCSACKLLINSRFESEKATNGLKSNNSVVDLPLQSIFIHLNEQILYSTKNDQKNDNQNDTKHQQQQQQHNLADKSVLLIGYGGIKRLPVLNSIKQLNLKRLVCLARQRDWATSFVDDWILAEHENLDQKEETLKRIVEYELKNEMKFDAILTYDDFCILMASYLQEKFSMPGIPLEFLEKIKNKFEFRRMCNKLEISAPKYFLVNYDDMIMYADFFERQSKSGNDDEYVYDLSTAAAVEATASSSSSPATANDEHSDSQQHQQIRFPIIVKNIYGCGKDFVKKCNDLNDFIQCLRFIQENKMKINVLVEEFFDGHEIDLDILIQDNQLVFLAITDNFPPIEPWFFEQGGILPSIFLSDTEKKAIEIIVSKWISKMNFQNAVLHFEARCKPNMTHNIFPSSRRNTITDYRNNGYHDDDESNGVDLNNNPISDKNKSDSQESIHEEIYLNFLLENESMFLMPIEINSRLGGAEVWSFVRCVYDLSLIDEYVKMCLGIRLNRQHLKQKQSSPIYQCISKDIHPAINARLDSISVNMGQLARCEKAVELNIFRSPGDSLTYKDYVGFATIISDVYDHKKRKTIGELLKSQENVLNLINLNFIKNT